MKLTYNTKKIKIPEKFKNFLGKCLNLLPDSKHGLNPKFDTIPMDIIELVNVIENHSMQFEGILDQKVM